MRTLLVVLTLTIPLAVVAQDTAIVVPNGVIIHATIFKPYSKKFIMYKVKKGVEEKTGTLSDQYTIFTESKSKLGLRIINIKLPSFEILDSGYVHSETLLPIYHRSHQTNKTILLDFKSNTITGV